jgi:DNA-directed RNA polymerase specialized sigma subunit
MPIAANQARILSSSSGIGYDLLFAEAQLGISVAVARGEITRPGFWRYAKFCIRGYMLNYLRDHSRTVRTPRDLSVLYLAEQALIKRRPELRHAGDQARAELLNVTTEKLNEARMAVNFYSSDVANYDRCDNSLTLSDEEHSEQMLYDLAYEVISSGLQVVSSKAKVSKSEVSDRFNKAMALLSERGLL